MTHARGKIVDASFLAAAAVAAAALFVDGCGSSCNCPQSPGYTTVAVPAAQASSIASVSTNAPCTASSDSTGRSVIVQATAAGTCQIHVQLTNGDTDAFSIQFEAMTIGNDCKCVVIRVAGASAAALVDPAAD